MHYSRRVWCCPYYRYDKRYEVHCEGGSIFKICDREIFADHADKYCGNAKGWENCQLAKALTRLYEKRDDRDRKRKSAYEEGRKAGREGEKEG